MEEGLKTFDFSFFSRLGWQGSPLPHANGLYGGLQGRA